MNTEEVREILDSVTCDVLQEAAFVCAEEAMDDVEWEEDAVVSVIGFGGELNGDITLAVSESTAKEMGANLLGMDEDEVSEEISLQAVSEMLNILCGVFLEKWMGDNSSWNMGLPDTSKKAPAECEKIFETSAAGVKLEDEEGNRIDVFVNLNK